MKKTIWITGTLLAIGIVVILMYFSFFQGKGSSTTPEGTFVKEVGDETRLKVAVVLEETIVKEAGVETEGLKAALIPEGAFIKGAEVEWRQSA